MLNVQNIMDILASFAPLYLAESWDNVGLLIGNHAENVRGIIVALDATEAVIDEAIAKNCNVVAVHHPVIFQPLKRIDTSCSEGRIIQKAMAHNIAIIASHTNFDNVADGVSHYLASSLGLQNCQPLLPKKSDGENDAPCGTGCIGYYQPTLSRDDYVNRIFTVLSCEKDGFGVQVTGEIPEQIHCVAICGGSGGDFAEVARSKGADIYLTGEVKHHIALWAVGNNFCVIDGSHYATEKPAMRYFAKHLDAALKKAGWQGVVLESENEEHPFTTIYKS